MEHMRRRKTKAAITRCYQLAVERGLVPATEPQQITRKIRLVGSVAFLRPRSQQPMFGSSRSSSLGDEPDDSLSPDEISTRTVEIVVIPPQRGRSRDQSSVPDWRTVRYRRVAPQKERGGATISSSSYGSYGSGSNNWEEVGLDDFLLMIDSVEDPWNLRDTMVLRVRRTIAKDWVHEDDDDEEEKLIVDSVVSSLLLYSIDKGKDFAEQFYIDSDEEMFGELVRAETRLISRLKHEEAQRLDMIAAAEKEQQQFTFGQGLPTFDQAHQAFGQPQPFGQSQLFSFGSLGSSKPSSSFGGSPPSSSFTFQGSESSNFQFGATPPSSGENGAASNFSTSRTTSGSSSTVANSTTSSRRRRRRKKK